jgi:hypothetical protein
MTSNASLTGAVSVALDGSKVTASGQFTTADGFPVSESIDLTALLTPTAKQQVLLLIGSLEQQYQQLRQNLLPQSKFLLADQSYLSAVSGARVAPDTTLAYTGAQSAKITTPGAAAGEGVSLALGGVPKGATVRVTVMVQASTGTALTMTLTDSTNTSDAYTAVTPATTPQSYTRVSTPISASVTVAGNSGAWQAATLNLSAGSANLPTLVLELLTTTKAADSWWLGAVQVTVS